MGGDGSIGHWAQDVGESRPWLSERQEIPLRLTSTGLEDVQEATLSVEGWVLPDGWRARIADTETGRKRSLGPGASAEVVLPADSIRETARYELQVAPTGEPLPVELAGFEATEDGEDVHLTWQTASETNNAGFRVQRRSGGRAIGESNPSVQASRRDAATRWKTIGTLEGSGTTQKTRTYRFRDTDPPFAADTLYYRLRQVDTDGTTQTSETVTVVRSGEPQMEVHGTYPNPAGRQATIHYSTPRAAEVRLEVYDMLGRRMRTIHVGRREAGRKRIVVDVSDLAPGTYFYRLSAGGRQKTHRFTVVR